MEVRYKRERDGRWKGPAKVIFQDGKVIWVRHGASVVRVSANRLVKHGEEYAQASTDDEIKTKEVAVDNTAESNEPGMEVDEIETEKDECSEGTQEGIGHLDINPNEIMDNQEGIGHPDTNPNEVLDNLPSVVKESVISTDKGGQKRKASFEENNAEKRGRFYYPPSRKQKLSLRKDDWINVKVDDEWLNARVLNREKETGKYQNHFKRNVDSTLIFVTYFTRTTFNIE